MEVREVSTCSPFARLISHQPAVLFSQNEPATSNQPQPASSTLLSEQTSTSHQPPANRTGVEEEGDKRDKVVERVGR
jgi:hypothetical protein